MDFYLTSLQSGERLRFPLLPDRLNVRTGAMTVSLNIIKTGEVKIPRGSILAGYSWNGMLPSEAMQGLSFVYDWQAPARIIDLLRKWEDEGQTLRFMVTDLSINVDVFIEAFTYEYYGAGNVSYTLNLTIRRELTITTVAGKPATPPSDGEPSSDGSGDGKKYGTVRLSNKNGSLTVRQKPSTSAKSLGKLKHGKRVEILGKKGNWYIIPYATGTGGKAYVYKSYIKLDGQSSSKPNSGGSGGNKPSSSSGSSSGGSYKVKKGDTLYSIAKARLGDGSRWKEIYNMNKKTIDAANKGKTVSRYTLQPGISLKLPAKKSSKKTSRLAKTIRSAVSNVASAVKTYVTKNPNNAVVKVASRAVKTASSVFSKIGSLFKRK